MRFEFLQCVNTLQTLYKDRAKISINFRVATAEDLELIESTVETDLREDLKSYLVSMGSVFDEAEREWPAFSVDGGSHVYSIVAAGVNEILAEWNYGLNSSNKLRRTHALGPDKWLLIGRIDTHLTFYVSNSTGEVLSCSDDYDQSLFRYPSLLNFFEQSNQLLEKFDHDEVDDFIGM